MFPIMRIITLFTRLSLHVPCFSYNSTEESHKVYGKGGRSLFERVTLTNISVRKFDIQEINLAKWEEASSCWKKTLARSFPPLPDASRKKNCPIISALDMAYKTKSFMISFMPDNFYWELFSLNSTVVSVYPTRVLICNSRSVIHIFPSIIIFWLKRWKKLKSERAGLNNIPNHPVNRAFVDIKFQYSPPDRLLLALRKRLP